MSIFCFKQINKPVSFSQRVKEARKKQEATIKEISKATRIPEDYVVAIERGEFKNLPKTKVHRLAYIKRCAEVLNLDSKNLANQFIIEKGLEDIEEKHPRRNIKYTPFSSLSFLIRNAVIAVFILIFVGYLAWQVRGIVNPPKLVIYSPTEGHISMQSNVTIQGETEKECWLNVNGQEIRPNSSGIFQTNIDLSKGVNTITISATKKHGKTTTIVRHIVVKEGKVDKLGQK